MKTCGAETPMPFVCKVYVYEGSPRAGQYGPKLSVVLEDVRGQWIVTQWLRLALKDEPGSLRLPKRGPLGIRTRSQQALTASGPWSERGECRSSERSDDG